MKPASEIEINLAALSVALWRRRVLALVLALIGGAGGVAWYKLSDKKYSGAILFVRQEQESGLKGLGSLGILAGGLGGNLGESESPVLAHVEKFVKTREFAGQLKDSVYSGRTLFQRLVPEPEKAKPDADEAFFHALTGLYEVEKENSTISFKVRDKDPDFCVYLPRVLYHAFQEDHQAIKMNAIRENLAFLEGLVEKYRLEKGAASERLEQFLANNQSTDAPHLQKKRNDLFLDVKLAEEKYVVAVKEREAMKIKNEKREEELIVLENPFRPSYPVFPNKYLCLALPVLGCWVGLFLWVAARDRRKWLVPVRSGE